MTLGGAHGHGLSFMTSNRGACHVASTIGYVEQNWITWSDVGITSEYDPKADEGKGELNVRCESLDMLTNSATMCRFALMAMAVTDLAEALKAATGFDYDPRRDHGMRRTNLDATKRSE